MDYYGYQVYNRNDIRLNGKWRYYYDDPEYRNALNSYSETSYRQRCFCSC